MKRTFYFLCSLLFVLAEDETSECNPSSLKPVRDCCNIPHHSNDLLQNVCYTRCALKSIDVRSDCAVDCYVNMTGLIRDGSINKSAAKRIYENNAYHDRVWLKLIGDGVDKCNFESTESLTENLIKFYNCVDDFLSENCVSFIQTSECDKVEEHFETCKNIQPDCSVWPKHLMNPAICCQTPSLFSETLNSKCRTECHRKQFLLTKQIECLNNCTYIETGLKAEGKFNFEVVKKMLIESSGNKSEIWEKPIENAVNVCEKFITGKEEL